MSLKKEDKPKDWFCFLGNNRNEIYNLMSALDLIKYVYEPGSSGY